MRTSISAVGAVAPDVAWERYADLDHWSGWAPQITAVRTADGSRRLRAGLEGTVRAVGVVPVAFRVLAVDEAARTWSWRVRLGPVALHLEHGVDAADPAAERTGTRTRLVTTGPALVVVPYTPLALVALHSLVLDR